MRFRVTPRDTTFFDLFTASANHLVTGSDLLAKLLEADRDGRKALAKEISATESATDEATHQIMRKVAQTFVTPFDRDDIYALASALDDCMDYMDEAADLIVLYKVDELPERVTDQVRVLHECAVKTAEAMPRLKEMDNLADYWVEINRLENQADKSYRKLLGWMFDQVADPIQLMKWKEIIDILERAADAFEKVANTVETIALKES